MTGTVYFIQEGQGGAIKIGWTSNCPHRRRDNLQIGNSEDLYLLGVLPNADQSIEAEWHDRFSEFRKRSEWFWPSESLMRAIDEQFAPPRRQSAPDLVVVSDKSVEVSAFSDWMQAQGLKDADAAELFGCERSHFSKVRRGKARPGTDLCLKVNEVTGIPLHELRPDIYPEPQAA